MHSNSFSSRSDRPLHPISSPLLTAGFSKISPRRALRRTSARLLAISLLAVFTTGGCSVAGDIGALVGMEPAEEKNPSTGRFITQEGSEEPTGRGGLPGHMPSVRLPISVLVVGAPTPPRTLLAGERAALLTPSQRDHLTASTRDALLAHPYVEQVVIAPLAEPVATAYARANLARRSKFPFVAVVSVTAAEREGRLDVSADVAAFGADGAEALFSATGGASAAAGTEGGGVPEEPLRTAVGAALAELDLQMTELHVDLRKQALDSLDADEDDEEDGS